MSVTPVDAVGNNAAKAIQEYMQSVNQASDGGTGGVNSIASAVETSAPTTVADGGNGFVDSIADTVFNEIEALSSKVPDFGSEQSAVSAYKEQMVPSAESISPLQETQADNGKDKAVEALSKTFDHAVFMAMVNQVISGVSDTSRTLIRQT